MTNINIEEIITQLIKQDLSKGEVSKILNNPKEFPSKLIEKISIETAINYWNNDINYEQGDCIMNNIHSYWVFNNYFSKNYSFTKIAWECFKAFDSGELHRKGDDKSIDPSEKYTRPLIKDFLSKRNLI
jgi:hypothetical protein